MSVNKYLPHVHVLPEDDANRQIANGFLLDQCVLTSKIQILEEAGGWNEVIERFCSIYASEMERYQTRFMILLIDLDNKPDRLGQVKNRIPQHLADRVFILGALTEPEDLRSDLGSYEKIGLDVAQSCREEARDIWAHRLLCHNAPELARLRATVRPFLIATD
jgi:hypothetical protein